jgi:hypothetical protein
MLPGDKPNPGRQVASGGERFPIAHLSDQGGSDNRANARYFLEPPAFFGRTMPGVNVLLDGPDLCRDGFILTSQNRETEPRSCWNPIVVTVANDLDQLGCTIRPLAEMMPSSAIWPRIAFDSIVR